MNNKEYIDNVVFGSGNTNEVLTAFKEIKKIQEGSKRLLTGVECLDYFLLDGLVGKIISIGSRPSMGKTYQCSRIIKNLLDEKLNPSKLSILRLN